MRHAFFTAAISLLLWAILHAQNPEHQQDSAWHAPADAAGRSNPLAQKPQAAAGGRKLFQRNCVECHGEDGSGIAKKHAADLQLPIVQDQTDGILFWKITNGNPDRGMPSFGRLPELQRWQIVLYLRTLKAADLKPAAR
jgi:mono/diheme cytochrome c family protein